MLRTSIVPAWVLGLTPFVLASGCATYIPEPVSPAASAAAFAADRPLAPDAALDETAALELALARSPAVRRARAAYASAVADARAARVRMAPTLNLTTEYSRQADPQHPWLRGGTVDVPLDAGTPRRARVETADLGVLKARYDVAEAVWSTRTALRKALIDRRAALAQLETATAQLDLQRQRVVIHERRVVAGEDDRAFALQARADLAAAQQQVSAARALQGQADAMLAAALAAPVESVAGATVASADVTPPGPAALEAARLEAATARADVLKAVVDYDIAEQALRQAVAAQYPALTISPGYTWERGVTKLPLSLGLALPPPDLNRAAIAAAETRRYEAGRALEAAQAQVFAECDAAHAALTAAEDDLARLASQDAPLAERGEHMAARRAALGEGDRAEWLAARSATLAVALARIEAARQRAIALADFEAAARRAFDPAIDLAMTRVMAALEGQSR